ncbi:MAG: acyl-CoA thioesterase, partial [Actinobacteria bacterium]|nr:acyl-CoA thioesterase [Actinomycetota bacterium]
HMDATFASTSTVDDVLDMDVVCERVGSSSLVLVYTLTRDDQKVFQGVARYVNVDESGTPTPIPDVLRTALAG